MPAATRKSAPLERPHATSRRRSARPLAGPILILIAVVLSGLPAWGRIKIDRYEASALPEIKLWVTLLDKTRPMSSDAVRSFSVHINGRLQHQEVDFETAAEMEHPLGVAVVVDARMSEPLRAARAALTQAFGSLPEGSRGLGVATNEGSVRLPKEGWAENPADLPASFSMVEAGGEKPRLGKAIRLALQNFPLAPGLEPEAEDGEVPAEPGDDDPPFPTDRVLYVIGDGHLETETGGKTASDRLRELVHTARRRGVRVMAIGMPDDETRHLWTLRVLARKTGGTYRRAPSLGDLAPTLREAAAELAGRFVLTVDAPNLRPGDPVSLMVSVQLKRGRSEEAREYSTQVTHEMSWFAQLIDDLNDTWEQWPWWARAIVWLVVALIATLVALIVLVRRMRKRARARKAAAEARATKLAGREPCSICGRTMMADWTECLFCAEPEEAPMRFRLTGRSGDWAGELIRFDRDLITFGSAPHCDVLVADRGVQTEHCGLRDRGGDEFVLTDFNTNMGTWINGDRITQSALHEGDLIRVGQTEFVFGIETEA